jgi:hypothetical protein
VRDSLAIMAVGLQIHGSQQALEAQVRAPRIEYWACARNERMLESGVVLSHA